MAWDLGDAGEVCFRGWCVGFPDLPHAGRASKLVGEL